MKAAGFIVLLIGIAALAVLVVKQRKAPVKMTTTLAPHGKEVELKDLPTEVKGELDNMNEQMEKRNREAMGPE
jgi:hypothetical protein